MTCIRDRWSILWALGLCLAGGFPALAWQSDNGDGTFTNPRAVRRLPRS